MSFNIRYGLAPDGDQVWDNRKAMVIARIRAFEPDLLGMQECRADAQADYVQTQLPDYDFYGMPRGGEGESALEMAPALIRRSAFQVVQQGCFWLSETPQQAGSKSWDSVFARTVTWQKLLHRPSARLVWFLNTHFDYQPQAIVHSARLLRQWITQTVSNEPLILTGDFNTDKDSRAYHDLTVEGGLQDVFQHSPDIKAGTFHGFGQTNPSVPIDWILTSRHFEPMTTAVDQHQAGQHYPSDHFPIMASLNWNNA